jgi:hypothetical protein
LTGSIPPAHGPGKTTPPRGGAGRQIMARTGPLLAADQKPAQPLLAWFWQQAASNPSPQNWPATTRIRLPAPARGNQSATTPAADRPRSTQHSA